MSEDEVDMADDPPCDQTIEGAPIDEDGLETFLGRGRSLRATLHPYLDLSAAWIGPGPTKNAIENSPTSFQAVEASLYQASSQYCGSNSRLYTSFTLDCAEIYEELQITYNDDLDLDVPLAISNASKKYLHKFNVVNTELDQIANSQGLDEDDETWQSTLVEALSIWSCAAAMYMIEPGALVCDGLMEWVNGMDPRPTLDEGRDIVTARTPYRHPQFWEYVTKGIVRGLFEMIGTCLADSGLADLDSSTARATNDLCLLLRTCPRVSKYVNKIPDFRNRHKLWRAKVSQASRDLSVPDPEISAAFRQIYELLKGDKDAVCRQCDTWQECLAALALLFDPTGIKGPVDVRGLFELVTESHDYGLSVDRTLPAEEACAALCSESIARAMLKARSVHPTTTALLADLLEKSGFLEEILSGDSDLTIRDRLVMELGDACMTQRGAWRAAITYWRTVGDAGLDSIQEVITRIPTNSQVEVDEILAICTDLDLHDEASTIESVWARKLENSGNHDEAIMAYDRAKNPHQIDRLNWRLFEDSLLTGQASSGDKALKNSLLSPEMTSSTTIATLMAPYATLATFYSLKQSGDSSLAAIHLGSLLKSSDVPKQYTAVLMAEMLPFLDARREGLTQRDVYDSLAAIEEYYDATEYKQGLHLLSLAMKAPAAQSGVVPDWRAAISSKFDAADVVSLVRLQLAKALGRQFCS